MDTKAKFQIVILDEADSMTTEAQSALRRIIEDYISQTRFCIICNYSSKIIDPIASRCAKFRFKSLSKESQIQRLKYICEQEKITVPDKILEILQNVSEGDLRRSINLLQSISQLGLESMTEEIVFDVCGIIPKNIVNELVNNCRKLKIDDLMIKIKESIANGYDLKILINQLNEYFTDDNSIEENKKYLIFEILVDKETNLNEKSNQEILAYDLLVQISQILKNSI